MHRNLSQRPWFHVNVTLLPFELLFAFRETSTSKQKISSEKWIEYARIAFSVDPKIALSLAMRFPTNTFLKAEVTQLVQVYISLIKSWSRKCLDFGLYKCACVLVTQNPYYIEEH